VQNGALPHTAQMILLSRAVSSSSVKFSKPV
jgi:hypothetical protein